MTRIAFGQSLLERGLAELRYCVSGILDKFTMTDWGEIPLRSWAHSPTVPDWHQPHNCPHCHIARPQSRPSSSTLPLGTSSSSDQPWHTLSQLKVLHSNILLLEDEDGLVFVCYHDVLHLVAMGGSNEASWDIMAELALSMRILIGGGHQGSASWQRWQ